MEKEIGQQSTRINDPEEISAVVVDEAFRIHNELGPGLLESVYASVLINALMRRGLQVEREKAVVFEFDGIEFREGSVQLSVSTSFFCCC